MKLKDLIIEKRETTIGEFCKAVGISRTTYDYIMNGGHEPSLVTIKKICKHCGVDFRDYI